MPPGKEFSNPTKGENEWMAVFIPYAIAEATELITSRDVIERPHSRARSRRVNSSTTGKTFSRRPSSV